MRKRNGLKTKITKFITIYTEYGIMHEYDGVKGETSLEAETLTKDEINELFNSALEEIWLDAEVLASLVPHEEDEKVQLLLKAIKRNLKVIKTLRNS